MLLGPDADPARLSREGAERSASFPAALPARGLLSVAPVPTSARKESGARGSDLARCPEASDIVEQHEARAFRSLPQGSFCRSKSASRSHGQALDQVLAPARSGASGGCRYG
mmetsp:Transcript_14927/g.24616  ORF Transcript_14927/g.24616 Transcript_14927/m.24616 type:complete len:112 (-) Transcript_14927:250-585(-)